MNTTHITREWKELAITLAEQGMSWRKIAKYLEKPKSSVSDALRQHYKGYVKPNRDLVGTYVSTIPSEVLEAEPSKEFQEKLLALETMKLDEVPVFNKNGVDMTRIQQGSDKIKKMVKMHKYNTLKGAIGKRLLFICDTQVKPEIKRDYLSWIGELIADKQPDIIVHAGDHYDFPSLSSYDKGKASAEGKRVKADIDAGNEGMKVLLTPMWDLQKQQIANNEEVYSPRMVFTVGNHENRADRFAEDNPEMQGLVGVDALNLEQFGWEVAPFLTPVEIEGVFFAHYFANPMTGKPYGGSALSMLKTIGRSFAMGHRQVLDIAIRPTIDGKQQIGLIAGAAYTHQEGYKGVAGNNHFRGVVMFNNLKDGYANLCPINMEYLELRYGTT